MICLLWNVVDTFILITSAVQHKPLHSKSLKTKQPNSWFTHTVKFLPKLAPKTKLDKNCDMHISASRELKVSLNGQRLKHEFQPLYLGTTLDRMLSYGAHLSKTAAKLKTCNNLISKLAGSTCGGTKMDTLHTSACIKSLCTRGVWHSHQTARGEPQTMSHIANQVRRWTDDSTWYWRRCCQQTEFCGNYSSREIITDYSFIDTIICYLQTSIEVLLF